MRGEEGAIVDVDVGVDFWLRVVAEIGDVAVHGVELNAVEVAKMNRSKKYPIIFIQWVGGLVAASPQDEFVTLLFPTFHDVEGVG